MHGTNNFDDKNKKQKIVNVNSAHTILLLYKYLLEPITRLKLISSVMRSHNEMTPEF